MSRLIHSSAGFYRSLQMSSAQFFAFVEGGLDRPFFDRVLERELTDKQIKHQVVAVKEIPGFAGGKIALLGLFKRYRAEGKLGSNAFGKKMICAFFADKDSDDYSRRQLRSPNLIYTQTYDLESHLFSCGDLQRALADSCGMTMQQARVLIPDQDTWLSEIAMKWKSWTALCMISHSKNVNCGCTYDRHSAVNLHPFADPDPSELERFKLSLANAIHMSRVDFDSLFSRVERKLDGLLTSGMPLRYFKGKWLLNILQKHLECSTRPADALINSAGEKVIAALVAQVGSNGRCDCCSPFSAGVTGLVAALT